MLEKEMPLKEVINAAGKLTALGVSRVSNKVVDAQKYGGQTFFEMDELMKASGCYLAKLLKVEAVQVVNSASAGIVQSIAGVIGKGSSYHAQHPYETTSLAREIVVPKGHNVDFGVPLSLLIQQAGGVIKEAGYANKCYSSHVSELITEQTAALLFVKSHHAVQKSMVSLIEMVKLAQAHQLPLIVDAAAEEELSAYYQAGADLVIYSGGKAIEGPTSGLVIGKARYIDWVRLQGKGLGRSMKVGKENIFGLIQAIESYLERDKAQEIVVMKAKLQALEVALQGCSDLEVKTVQDSAGRKIYRLSIKFPQRIDGEKAVAQMKNESPAVYFREHQINQNIIEVDVRSVTKEELNVIADKIKRVLVEA